MTQLEYVYLNKSQFDASCVDLLLASAPSLCTLDLIACQGLSDACLGKLATEPTGLKLIALHDCDGVTEQSLLAFIIHCPQLTSILFTGTVTDAALIAIAEHCGPRLRYLALDNVRCTSDAGLDALTRLCTHIESLRWASVGASMPALCCFLRAQTRLVELSLDYCKIDDSVLQSVAGAHGLRLDQLHLYATTGYTVEGLWSLARQCTALNEVSVEANSSLLSPTSCGWWRLL